MGWYGMDWVGLAQDREQSTSCEHGDDPSGSINCLKVLELLHNWQLLKKGSAP
jgi:hypothetical protein